jgi:hypothetical protein
MWLIQANRERTSSRGALPYNIAALVELPVIFVFDLRIKNLREHMKDLHQPFDSYQISLELCLDDSVNQQSLRLQVCTTSYLQYGFLTETYSR